MSKDKKEVTKVEKKDVKKEIKKENKTSVLEIIITAVLCLAVIAGCVFWYITATNKEPEVISEEPIFTKEDYPKVDASLAIHPLVNTIASNFMGVSESELDYTYTTGRSSEVYHNLIDGKVDVIFAAEISNEDLGYAKDKGVELDIRPATSSAFVFVVNKDNKIEGLTLEQIQDIYQGRIINWKEVGGSEGKIIAYQRPNGSGSQTAMQSIVMKDKMLKKAETEEIEAEMAGLINAVGNYDNSINALGYSYFYYVNTMYKNENIKMISVDGIMPSLKTIKDGSYPLYTNGYIVTRKNDTSDATKKWVNEVLGARGSKIISEAGYVPLEK